MELLAKLIVFLPLLSCIIIASRIHVISDRVAQGISCAGLVMSAIGSAIIFMHVYKTAPIDITLLEWIHSGDFIANWGLRIDMLTAVMLIVITWVSAVVHIYSVGYMSHDPHKPRFMAYLSLFTFCMLMLVTADNFIQLFFGWEGVGLSSYLLIGFWFHKDSANAASMKAFIVNRVGDVFLALGIAMVFLVFNSVTFTEIFPQIAGYDTLTYNVFGINARALDIIGVLLFIGCMGKSAQFLLHTWLPDAMEGPTPVSALIHAATMVTAGVFLLARFSPLYEFAPAALTLITVVGAFTAFFAASIGLVQNDIKRVIAYSTCSQLGYMFFACGIGAYPAAVFHLMTHAFFKALLFLGAGSVIHGMSDEQDMRRMGGVFKMLPVTYGYMWIGSLALTGIPFFAGFYSKDLIIEAAYAAEGTAAGFAFIMGITAAFFTAFYSGRLLFMTFHGKPRASKETMSHVHESPKIMTVPLIVLAFGALFAGYIGANMLGMVDADGDFWQGSVVTGGKDGILDQAHHVPQWVPWLPLLVALSGFGLSWLFYVSKTHLPQRLANNAKGLYQFLYHKWYIDELYNVLFVQASLKIGQVFWKRGDEAVINRLGPDGASGASLKISEVLSRFQNGYIHHYAFIMMCGVVALLVWFVRLGMAS